MSLVSVIIPTFNRKNLLQEAINSALGQTFEDLEVIVVDDGSTDGTGEMVRAQYANEPRLRYIWQENAERSAARNRGIQAASGEFIAFLDSDDLWLPSKLEKQLPYLAADATVSLVHSGYSKIDAQGRIICDVILPAKNGFTQGDIFRRLLLGNIVGAPTPLVRRSAFQQAGLFNEDRALLCFEDWEMWTRLAYHGRVAYVAEPLAMYRVHSGNTASAVDPSAYRSYVSAIYSHVHKRDRAVVRLNAARVYWFLLKKPIPWAERWVAGRGLVESLIPLGGL